MFLESFVLWSILWVIALVIPPGSKAIATAYRFNIIHGVISTIGAGLCLLEILPEKFTSTITISYFIVDFVNNLLNDFVFKAKSYQPPAQRRVEYFHHIFCCFVGISCEFFYKKCCDFDRNPFIKLMFAEVSTPFLMLWRIYPESDIAGWLFLLVFIGNRLIYHGIFFIPQCVQSCNKIVAYSFGIPYDAMNIFFFFMILRKLLRGASKSGKKD